MTKVNPHKLVKSEKKNNVPDAEEGHAKLKSNDGC